MRVSLLSVPVLGAALAAALGSPKAAPRFSPSALPSSAWSPSALSSTVELAGSLARSTAAYTLRKDSAHPDQGDTWVVGVQGAGNNVGFVEATEGKGGARRKVELVPVGSDDTTTYYQLVLHPPHSSDMTYVTLSAVLPHASRPEPREMPQNADSIYMLFEGDLLAPLAGLPKEQRAKLTDMKVRVKTPTPRIVSATAPEGFVLHQQSGSATVTFTLQGDAATLPPQIARVHYQQPDAVASIRSLDRLVELSHWGANLAIQDTIDLFNAGPKLMGQFARIDYQKALMHRRQHLTAVSSLSLSLPPSTRNPYFYDLVGNVSTSRFRPSPALGKNSNKAVLPSQKRRALLNREPAVLELQPRYPLLGGWNYSFTVGYDLPLGEYVKARGGAKKGQYVAAVPFLTPVKDVAVDEVRVEVRLPEGARDIAVHAPFPLTSLSYPSSPDSPAGENLAWTYLDSTGRPTVIMTKTACTDRHGGDVLIEYTLPVLTDALQKPLAAAAVLFALFVAVVAARRVSCGIAPASREVKRVEEKGKGKDKA